MGLLQSPAPDRQILSALSTQHSALRQDVSDTLSISRWVMLTLVPVWMRWIVWPMIGAIERTVILSRRFSGGSGLVSVTTIWLIGLSCRRWIAGPERMACVAATWTSVAPCFST